MAAHAGQFSGVAVTLGLTIRLASMPKVYNKRGPYPKEAVYVGRPTVFGNPYSHLAGTLARFRASDRNDAIEKFRAWAWSDPAFIQRVKDELCGRDLVCWCAPLACHADVLLEIANGVT